MPPSRPYVSIAFTNRNDNYGGDLNNRIRTFIDYYARYAALEKLYDQRGLEQFGIHPEMIPLYAGNEAFAAIRHTRGVVYP